MNNKERFDLYKKSGIIKSTAEERIKALGDRLLESLYKPAEGKSEFIPDRSRIKKFGVDETEPINWGDLGCSVVQKGNYYLVTIEEASPGGCPTLCEYIEKYMISWGWNVKCETEW